MPSIEWGSIRLVDRLVRIVESKERRRLELHLLIEPLAIGGDTVPSLRSKAIVLQ